MSIDSDPFYFPDPNSIPDRNQPYTLLSIVGKNYQLNPAEGKLGIALHRGFTKDQLRTFLLKTRKSKIIRSFLPIRTNAALVITNDPKNLSNNEYQTSTLRRVFSQMEEGTMSPVEDDKEDKDAKAQKDNEPQKFLISDYAKESMVKMGQVEILRSIENNAMEFLDKEEWLKEEDDDVKGVKDAKDVKDVQNIFQIPPDFKTSEKFALLQFISYGTDGELLNEPIIIVRGFFDTLDDIKEYKEKYFRLMIKHHEKRFITYLDLVPVPIDTLITPWYSRDSVREMKFSKGPGRSRTKNLKKLKDVVKASVLRDESTSSSSTTSSTTDLMDIVAVTVIPASADAQEEIPSFLIDELNQKKFSGKDMIGLGKK
jgi:hypothetical protein